MKRLFALFLACLFAFAPVAQADLRASSGAFGPVQATSGNVSYVLAKSAIPFISLSTGSVSAGGAITAITALQTNYANAYCWFPASILAASGTGSTAGWYFCQFSTTTAGTACLNTYTSGVPTIPSSCTAVTAGQGAFTGNAATVTGPTIPISAGLLGTKGVLRSYVDISATNSAGTKQLLVKYNAKDFGTGNTITTQIFQTQITTIQNRGIAASQVGRTYSPTQNSMVTGSTAYGTENSANALNWTLGLTMNTATDNGVIEQFVLEVQSDGT